VQPSHLVLTFFNVTARDFLLRTELRGCRVSLTRCTDALNEALTRWEWPEKKDASCLQNVAQTCFGPLLAGTVALNGFQKGDERIESLIRDLDGKPLARVESTHSGVVRAAFPPEPFHIEDLRTQPLPRSLVVAKVLYDQEEPYISTVGGDGPMSVDRLWERFFTMSEQIPTLSLVRTKVSNEGKVELCAGLTIQGLVGSEASPEELVDSFRDSFDSPERLDTLIGENGADWMRSLLPDLPEDFQVVERDDPARGKHFTIRPVSFFCPCSLERMVHRLSGVVHNHDDLFEEDSDELEVVCSYCNSKYDIGRDMLAAAK